MKTKEEVDEILTDYINTSAKPLLNDLARRIKCHGNHFLCDDNCERKGEWG